MKLLRVLLVVAYPFLIFVGLRWFEPRWVALAMGGLLALRAMAQWHRPSEEELRQFLVPVLLVGAVLVPTLVWNDPQILLFVPVVMNLALLVAFGRTLLVGTPLVETFARMSHPELSPERVQHCRGVTRVWCVFFALNALVCVVVALSADLWIWTLYTGLVSYLLVGLVFVTELLVRILRFGRYRGAPPDSELSAMTPERPLW